MPYNHSFLTRGNGHRILISDIQLLQWCSKRRDIRRNPLPYSIVHNAVMDLLSNRETPVAQNDIPQLLITLTIDKDGAVATPPTPAVIQHAVPIPVAPKPPGKRPRPLTASIPVPPTASFRRDGRERTRTSFYKPHGIRAVSEAVRAFMDRDNPPPPIFQTDNDAMPSDTDIMRSYPVDTLFDSDITHSLTPILHPMATLRTRRTSAYGRSARPLSARERRSPTASRTSTKLEQQHAETHSVGL